MITIGLEKLLQSQSSSLNGKRLGLLTNQASVNRQLLHNRILLKKKFGNQLTTLFSPQHGFYSEKQDNMIESDHMVDDITQLPVYSLYGDLRKPNESMLADVDVLLVDLMDVGTRVYTFIYTMAYCLEAAGELDKKVIILDRPNPIDGVSIEGNILDDDCTSFVGLYPLPMRHGLTMGEIARLINQEYGIGAELEVFAMDGWQRHMSFAETGFPWVFPSPNMPTVDTAEVYPGQVIWEGTNISEGRGTTLPFELFGAPFIEHEAVLAQVTKTHLPGCSIRPLLFQPTSGKWANQICTGFHIHVLDRQTFKPFKTAITFLQAIFMLYPDQFRYKEPPYEYEYKRLPMDLIIGSRNVRKRLEQGDSVEDIEHSWMAQLDEFDALRQQYFIYT